MSLELVLALSSVVGAIGRTGQRMEVGLLKPGSYGSKVIRHLNGTLMCRGHGIPEMVTPTMRTTTVLLLYMPCSSGLASHNKAAPDEKNWRYGTIKSLFVTPVGAEFFSAILAEIYCPTFVDARHWLKFEITTTLRRLKILDHTKIWILL